MITGLEGPSGGDGPRTDIGLSRLNWTEESQREEKKQNWSLLHTNTLADSHQRQALPLFRYRAATSAIVRALAISSPASAVLPVPTRTVLRTACAATLFSATSTAVCASSSA